MTTWTPVKRSPVHHKLVEGGAVFESISRWYCATRFTEPEQEAAAIRSAVGLLDLSFAPKWELKGKEVNRHLESLVEEGAPQTGNVSLLPSGYVARISSEHALFVAQGEDRPTITRVSDRDLLSGCLHVTERTSGLGNLLLCGPQASAVLRKLTPLDLREVSFGNLRCAPTPMAGTPVTIVRRDRGQLAGYEILLLAEYGEYLWDCLLEAGQEFEMRPFGLVAHRLLEGE